MVHVGKDAYERIHENMENIVLKPYIIQGADTKVCSWVDENYVEEPKQEEVKAPEAKKTAEAAPAAENDEITKTVIRCAAEGYDVDEATITLATDIREDLSSESMKMIVMLSNIEEALDVVIEIPEAGSLNTIADFVNTVRAKLGISGTVSAEGAAAGAGTAAREGGEGELDDVAKTVITAAAEAYDADEDSITLSTDIREDLSSESMKMIVMLSNIEEELDVVIEISEAGSLNTIADFAALARKKLAE
jgi:acyl carrier protein